MFQRRPGKLAPVLDMLEDVKSVDGNMWWAFQKALVFGSGAKTTRKHRPVVVITFVEDRVYVLPGTTNKVGKFFCIRVGYCVGGEAELKKDGYFTPAAEVIKLQDLDNRMCSLTPFSQAQLIEWMRSN